jgi:DNA polymerase-3 subunit delta'
MDLNIYPWQQDHWERINKMRRSGRLPHALLFTGPEGVGLEHFVTALSASIFCEVNGEDQACTTCRACMLLQSGNHPDLLRIEPEEQGKSIRVDQIRELLDFIHLKSQFDNERMAVIVPADSMNRNAANALLKTLEEPPAGVLIALVSSFPERLPVTVRSRCQRLQFSEVKPQMARDWLERQVGYSEAKMHELLEMTPGKPLLALQQAKGDTLQNQHQVLTDLVELGAYGADIIRIAGRWQDYGTGQVFCWIMGFMRLCTHLKLQILDNLLEVEANNPKLHRIAEALNLQELIFSYDLALDQYHAVTGAFNLNRSGLLEDFIIHWQSMMNREEIKR